MQGGMAVPVLVHDCGTVCVSRLQPAQPAEPLPPYLLVELWCPTCRVVVQDRQGRVLDVADDETA